MSKRILFLDDEPMMLSVYASMFKDSTDYELLTEERSLKALGKIIKNKNIDLVVTDICMPYVSGIDFLKKLRKVDCNVPVIIVSGCVDIAHDYSMFNCKGVITKPFLVPELEKFIIKILGGQNDN